MFSRRLLLKGSLAAGALQALPFSVQARTVNAPFPIFDSHAHFHTIDPDNYPLKSDVFERTVDLVRGNPATSQKVLKFWDDAGIMLGTGVQYFSAFGTDNSYLLDVSAANPARVLPVVILSPTDPATPAKLHELARSGNIAGVRFTGLDENGEHTCLTEAAIPSWEAIDELGLVAVLMLFGGDANAAMGKVRKFAMRFPNVKIVLDHCGFPDPAAFPNTFGFTTQHHSLSGHENVHFKFTSYLMFLTLDPAGIDLTGFMNYAADLYGAQQMLWGSDFGNLQEDHFAYLQRALDATAQMPYEARKAIFFDTAYKLFVPGGAR